MPSKRGRTNSKPHGGHAFEEVHAQHQAPGTYKVTVTQLRPDPKIKFLDTRCWCNRSTIRVPAHVVRACSTESCGRTGCVPPA